MSYTPTNWQTGDIVSSEKLNKLEQGVANAHSVEYIVDATDEWLEENITQETGYVLDRTLQAANAAAPADIVGDIQEDVSDAKNAIGELNRHLSDLETRLKSGDEEDADLHLGFYLDENGDLCQVDEEVNNG